MYGEIGQAQSLVVMMGGPLMYGQTGQAQSLVVMMMGGP